MIYDSVLKIRIFRNLKMEASFSDVKQHKAIIQKCLISVDQTLSILENSEKKQSGL